MHICRKCKKEKNPGASVKSKKGLANTSSINTHYSCDPQPWASEEEELKHPELLTESQEKFIMNWDKRSAKKRLGQSDVDDIKLWEELYFSLHGKRPGKLGAGKIYGQFIASSQLILLSLDLSCASSRHGCGDSILE